MHRNNRSRFQSFPCRVCLQNCTDWQASICCDGCQCWIHADCINMSHSVLLSFASSDVVCHVSFTSGHAPRVVFFTDEQMSDIKRFCGANAPDSIRSVFCVDRTFNVSSLFLTVTVFKNNSVLQNKAMQAPIFLVQCFCMATVLT